MKKLMFGLHAFIVLAGIILLAACELTPLAVTGEVNAQARNIAGYIYVSPSGSNESGNGTTQQPYKTIAKALTVASAGNTISLAAGTYTESSFFLPVNVSLIGAGSANTILTSNTLVSSGTPEDNANFLIRLDQPGTNTGVQTVAGFTIDGKNKTFNGIVGYSRSNITVNDIHFKNCAETGARIFGAQGYISNINITNSTFTNCGKDHLSGNPGWTSGNLMIGYLDGANISNIVINDIYGYGIKFTNDGNFKNTKVHDSIINVSETDEQWGEDIAIEMWNLGPGNEIYNIQTNTWLSLIDLASFSSNPSKAGDNLKLYNIRIIDTDGASVKEAIEIGSSGVDMYNCYIKDKGFGIAMWARPNKKNTIRQNIFDNQYTHTDYGYANGAAILIATGTGVGVYNNVIAGFKNAITLTSTVNGESVNDIAIRNNVFLMRSDATGIITKGSGQASNVVISNNLKITSDYYASNFAANNLAWTDVSGATVSNNYDGNPQFHNRGLGWDSFYEPQSPTSFVVGKGLDVGFGTTLGAKVYDGTFPAPDAARIVQTTTTVTFVPFSLNLNGVSSISDQATFGINTGSYGGASVSFPNEGVGSSTALKIQANSNAGVWLGALGNRGLGLGVSAAVITLKIRADSSQAGAQIILKPIVGPPSTAGGIDAAQVALIFGPGQTPWPAAAVDGNPLTFATISLTLPLSSNSSLGPSNYGVQLALTGYGTGCTIWIDDITVSNPSFGSTTSTTSSTSTTSTTLFPTTSTSSSSSSSSTSSTSSTLLATSTSSSSSTSSSTSTSTTSTTLPSAALGTGVFTIVNLASNKIQKPEPWIGGSISNNDYTGALIEQWEVTKVGAYYRFINKSSGHALDGSGNDAKMQSYSATDAQLWDLIGLGNSQYRMTNKLSTKAAKSQDVFNGNPMKMETFANNNLFKWTFTQLGGSVVTSTSTSSTSSTSSTVIAASSTSTSSTSTSTVPVSTTSTSSTSSTSTSSTSSTSTTSTTIVETGLASGRYRLVNLGANKAQKSESWENGSIFNNDYSASDSEKWDVSKVGSYYKIINVATGRALTAVGSEARMTMFTGSDSQLWTATSLGSGQYRLINKQSGLSARSQDIWNGNPMKVETYQNTALFKWAFLAP